MLGAILNNYNKLIQIIFNHSIWIFLYILFKLPIQQESDFKNDCRPFES